MNIQKLKYLGVTIVLVISLIFQLGIFSNKVKAYTVQEVPEGTKVLVWSNFINLGSDKQAFINEISKAYNTVFNGKVTTVNVVTRK